MVGGGVTGLSAALEAANTGFDVVLVEKQAQLGGFAAAMKKDIPRGAPYTEARMDGVSERIQAVTSHPRIKVHCSTKIVKTDGQPGMFDVTLQNGSDPFVHRVGAIVMATGWKPYDATKLTALGYGLPDVITNLEFEEMAAAGPIIRPSTGQPVESVLFVQCAGSRDSEPGHLPYCSSTCCMNTLKQTEYIREQNSRCPGLCHLQRHRHARPIRKVLPEGARAAAELLHEGQRNQRRKRLTTTGWW